jgi:hypothetical protein
MTLASAGSLLTEVVSTTIFQRTVPNVLRGRALGTIATISTLAYAAGSLVLPVMAGRVGITQVLVASAVLVVVGSLIAVWLIGSAGDHGPSAELTSVAARVAALTVFAGVPASRLADAFARALELDVSAGTVVIRQGEPADRFYVILAGRFDVDQTAEPEAAPTRLRTMAEDEVFGEIGLLTGSARTATVVAAVDGRLLALDAPDFLELVASAADVGPRMLAIHRGGAATS